MRNVIPLFSTPLFITEVTPVSDEIKKYISNVPYSKHDSNIKLSDEKHILDQPILKPLRDEILREFNYYVNDVLQIDSQDLTWELTTSWTTKSDPGDSSDVHNHRNSLISGVVYFFSTTLGTPGVVLAGAYWLGAFVWFWRIPSSD